MAINRLMTTDELLRMPDDGMRHELVAGELRTYPLNDWRHGAVAASACGALGNWVRTDRLGTVYAGEVGFLLEQDPDTVRAAAVAFVSYERIPPTPDGDCYLPVAPDLVVDVVLVFDLYVDMDE